MIKFNSCGESNYENWEVKGLRVTALAACKTRRLDRDQ